MGLGLQTPNFVGVTPGFEPRTSESGVVATTLWGPPLKTKIIITMRQTVQKKIRFLFFPIQAHPRVRPPREGGHDGVPGLRGRRQAQGGRPVEEGRGGGGRGLAAGGQGHRGQGLQGGRGVVPGEKEQKKLFVERTSFLLF